MNEAIVKETHAKIKSIIESDSVKEYFITSGVSILITLKKLVQ
jgi:hypothetical protein